MQSRRPVLWGELAVVAFLLLVYDRISDLSALRVEAAVRRGERLLQLERDLHVAVEPALDQLAAAHARIAESLSLYYDLAHLLVSMSVLAAVYAFAPTAYRRARRALVAVNLGALVVFFALPVAPPRLLPGGAFVDVVAHAKTWSAWQNGSVVAQHANEYASVPSLHVAWAVWVVLTVWSATDRRGLRALAVLHALTTVVVVVLTGNHYLADALAGGLLTALAWWLVGARPAPSGGRQRQQEAGPARPRLEVQVAAAGAGEPAGER